MIVETDPKCKELQDRIKCALDIAQACIDEENLEIAYLEESRRLLDSDENYKRDYELIQTLIFSRKNIIHAYETMRIALGWHCEGDLKR